jgi:GAF domain-containing protein
MRRRSRAGGERAKSQRHKAVTPKRRSAPESVGQETELARRTRERDEALEQFSATSEVLKVISGSAGELEPVFGAMLENATRICEATSGLLVRAENDGFRIVASLRQRADIEEMKHRTFRFGPSTPIGRAVRTRQIVHVANLSEDRAYLEREPLAVWAVEQANVRTVLVVPMLKREELVGVFGLEREEVKPFTDKQIVLVQTFAAQAVIAIENARLLNELRQRTSDLTESLEQQTATSEVLSVISRSPGNLQPVFEAVLENAVRICEAKFGVLTLSEGDALHVVAMHNAPPEYVEFRRREPVFRSPKDKGVNRMMTQAAATKRPVQIADITDDPTLQDDPQATRFVALTGARSIILVPMFKGDEIIGVMNIYRQEVRPFTEKQISLMTNFAAQAVIAIENTRLLNELRESLDRQTATADILRVIAGTPEDSKRALDTIAEKASRMFDSADVNFRRLEGNVLRVVSAAGPSFAKLREVVPDAPLEPPTEPGVRCVLENRQIAVEDRLATPPNEHGEIDRALLNLPLRSQAYTPLAREGKAIGVMIVNRSEVRPFQEHELELMKGFADQAVIAIENARLLNELRESLQQQTATSEVLRVISSFPGELKPVFQTMLENAVRVSGAKFGVLYLSESNGFRTVAMHDVPPAFAEFREREPVVVSAPGGGLERLAKTKQVVHIADYAAQPQQARGGLGHLGGARTVVAVPMVKDNELVGAIVIYRQQVLPFTDKQIALLQNFAAQAVIAIENTRLLNELRESLQQQTATSEVLGVISSSPGALEPVFHAVLANATGICEAKFGALLLCEGDAFRVVALHNAPPAFAEFTRRGPVRPGPNIPLGRMALTKQVTHVADITKERGYIERDPVAVAGAELGGYRTILVVPMLTGNDLIGAIAIFRQEVQPFTDKQIELVQNFAAQAVIAIENARLLNELRQRTGDLSEALEQQTATSEVLKVISSSPGDLEPVFSAMLGNATRICEAKFGVLFLYEGDAFRVMALHGAPPAYAEERRRDPRIGIPHGTALARIVETRQTVQIADIQSEPVYSNDPQRRAGIMGSAGARTLIMVPMLKDDDLLGAIAIFRQEVRPFTDKQIGLVTNFAAQAVIAIENTRLLNELRQSLEQQTATADVLRVI